MTNVTLNSFRVLYLDAYNGGKVDLRRVQAAAGAVQADARNAGSSSMVGRWKRTGSSPLILHAQTGASILVPGVAQLENATLEVDNTGTITTAQLTLLTNVTLTVNAAAPNFGQVTNIDDTEINAFSGGVARLTNKDSITNNVFRVTDGNQSPTWKADGTGSLLDLSMVTNVTVGYFRVLYVDAYNGGKVDLQRVQAAPGAVQVDARNTGSLVDLGGMAGRWKSTGSSPLILHAQTGASILIPNVQRAGIWHLGGR